LVCGVNIDGQNRFELGSGIDFFLTWGMVFVGEKTSEV
jgi:hypothetical protein